MNYVSVFYKHKKMLKYLVISLILTSIVCGVSIIDSRGSMKDETFDEIYGNSIKKESAECPNLTAELIKEIQSHQPIVDQIVSAVVNGKYSGDTWNA